MERTTTFPSVTKGWCHALIGAALLLGATIPGTNAQSKLTHYSDVQAGVWYEGSASALLATGALDPSESRLRPNDAATRAEMIKLLVRVYDLPLQYPSRSSFTDVSTSAWYFPYMEAAAQEGWVRGDRDCYQRLISCTARPADRVNRAEAAALLMRAFDLQSTARAPLFPDNDGTQWYSTPIQVAADHCILQGDDFSGRVRPAATMNRAEMVVMFHRASQNLMYGEDCGTTVPAMPRIEESSVESTTLVRLVFSHDLVAASAEDEARYDIERISDNANFSVRKATLRSNRTVELELTNPLEANVSYRVTASSLTAVNGSIFTDTTTVRWETAEQPDVTDIDVRSANMVRVTFNVDLDTNRAEEETHYRITGGGQGTVTVLTAVQVSDRVVELRLEEDLNLQAQYTLEVIGMRSLLGTIFSDTLIFIDDRDDVDLSAILRGLNEVPPTTSVAIGTGSFVLTSSGLSYDITVQNLQGTFTEAHFHMSPVGSNGSVVETIVFSGTRATGMWKDLTEQERNDLLDERIYVNVHTTTYPSGEIRGQVLH